MGNLNQYTQYQAAEAIRDAAQNPGIGGVGASIGAGAAIGNIMAEALKGNSTPQKFSENNTVGCPHCHSEVLNNHKFCWNVGNP